MFYIQLYLESTKTSHRDTNSRPAGLGKASKQQSLLSNYPIISIFAKTSIVYPFTQSTFSTRSLSSPSSPLRPARHLKTLRRRRRSHALEERRNRRRGVGACPPSSAFTKPWKETRCVYVCVAVDMGDWMGGWVGRKIEAYLCSLVRSTASRNTSPRRLPNCHPRRTRRMSKGG